MDVGLSLPDLANVSTEANWGSQGQRGGGGGGDCLRPLHSPQQLYFFPQAHIKTLSLARR